MTKRACIRVFQRGGVWCKPLNEDMMLVASESGGRKSFSVEPPRDSRVSAKGLVDSEGQ